MELYYWASLTFVNLQCLLLALVLHDLMLFVIAGTMLGYCGYQFGKKAGLL